MISTVITFFTFSLMGALAVSPNAEILERSPCSTMASQVRCRSGPGTSYDTVRVLGYNMMYHPTCRGIGEPVEGNRVWLYLGDRESCWVPAQQMSPRCTDSLQSC